MNHIKQLRLRRSEIVRELSDLSRDGWRKVRNYDYAELESELRELESELHKKSNNISRHSLKWY